MLDCRVNGVSKYDPYLEFEENTIPRKRYVRSKTPAITAKLHDIIALFYVREPTFSVHVINYYLEKCSSPLPSPHHGQLNPLSITVQTPSSSAPAPAASTPVQSVQPLASSVQPYPAKNNRSAAQQAFHNFSEALLQPEPDMGDYDRGVHDEDPQSNGNHPRSLKTISSHQALTVAHQT